MFFEVVEMVWIIDIAAGITNYAVVVGAPA